MTTEAAQSLVQHVFQAIESSNYESLALCFHPHVVYRRPGRPVLIGQTATVEYYRNERVALTSTIIVDDMIGDGRAVVAIGLVEGRSRDGRRLSERFADDFRFRDGLVAERTTYFFRTGF